MKRIYLILPAVLLVLMLIAPVVGGTAPANHQSEPEKLIKAVRLLEEQPFDKEAKKMREWALKWLIETDKVSVSVCSLLISGVEEKYKYKSEIFTQYTLGMAAFKLANPDKSDEPSVQLAGIESALKFYEAIIKEKPNTKSGFMDDLLAKRAAGSLSDYVAANNCKETKDKK